MLRDVAEVFPSSMLEWLLHVVVQSRPHEEGRVEPLGMSVVVRYEQVQNDLLNPGQDTNAEVGIPGHYGSDMLRSHAIELPWERLESLGLIFFLATCGHVGSHAPHVACKMLALTNTQRNMSS